MVNAFEGRAIKLFSTSCGENDAILSSLWRNSGGERGPRTSPSGRPDMTKFLKLIRDSKGATAIEYGLIAALIAVAAIAAMQNIGTKLGTTFNNVADKL